MKIKSTGGLLRSLIATLCAVIPQAANATLLYQWKFDGVTGTPTVSNGTGTLTAQAVGALGAATFGATGSTGAAGDHALGLSNDYSDGGGAVAGNANKAFATGLTGFGTLNTFTVTMWVNIGSANLSAVFPRLLQIGTATNPDNTNPSLSMLIRGDAVPAVELGVNSRPVTLTTGVSAANNGGTPGAGAFGANKWVFLAFTYDGTSATPNGSASNTTLYNTPNNAVLLSGGANTAVQINGNAGIATVAGGTVSTGPVNLTAPTNLYMGNRQTDGRGLTGSIDDVRIYDTQMTVAQLEAIRLESAPPPPAGGTPVYWKGTTSSDWTANNWTSDAGGLTPFPLPVDGSAAVNFAASSPLNMDTTLLGANQNIRALKFNTESILGTGGALAIGGTHNLTIGTLGVTLDPGAGQATINTTGQVILGTDQTWTNNAATPFTVVSQITGDFNLATAGSGITVLSAQNIHTGGTTVDSGTLQLGNVLALGPVTGSLNVAGGTVDVNGLSPTLGSLTGAGSIINSVVGDATLTVNNPADTNFGGRINNAAAGQNVSLVKNGPAILTLGGLSSFEGNITVVQGTLRGSTALFGTNNTANFGNLTLPARTITAEAGTTLSFNSNNVMASRFTNFALLPEIILNGSTLTANLYNGIGKITLNGGLITHTNALANTPSNYLGYQFKGEVIASGATTSFISGSRGNHLDTDTQFTVALDSSLTITTPLFNQSLDFVDGLGAALPGGYSKHGPGILAVNAANSYSGPTTVWEGTLVLSSAASLSNTSPFEMAAVTVDPNTSPSKLELNFTGYDIVSDFLINGVSGGVGTYGAIGSGATHEHAWITGTGFISVPFPDPYLVWIETYYPAPDPLGAKSADPDGDGLTNLQEFAFNSLPNSGTPSGKTRSQVETLSGAQVLVLTLPVRSQADFTDGTPATAVVPQDRLTYTVAGSNDLTAFDQAVSEISPSATGLPPLDTGWSYKSFRLDGDIGGANPRGPVGFLRASVTDQP